MEDKKSILFIAPTFFGYYKEIIKELEGQDFEVNYVCDFPSKSNFVKALGRLNRNFIKISMNRYFNKDIIPIIEQKKYDYVFVIVGMTFSFFPKMIEKIKVKNPNAKFVMYQWDGEKNISYIKDFHKFFDKVFTFDRIDCKKNNVYTFLPLFYIRNYESIGSKNNKNYLYDISYVGTAHPQKYYYVNEMSYNLQKKMPKQFIYHYMPSKLKYYYHKFFSKEFKNAKIKDFNFDKIPTEKMAEIFEESKCILDVPQHGQNGLTIRTIECLGAKKKLITTNADIKNYDFYLEDNILIYDGKVNFDSPFFKSDYKEIEKNIYDKYSLRNWLKEILS